MNLLSNWKTTAAGLAAVFGGLATITHAVATSPLDPTAIYSGVTSIAAGIGLLAAKDGNVTGGSVKQ
ncbi:hypothetical protein SAMN05519103_00368 [Rhizobiales bacterium GAS113]|nr:hypothetical protein SAMN05519103_00368 [Rhizobiales bacterium GAS113]